ncbi:MAG: hypothetical protein JNL18_01530 [Planctomycetaceae bacterium]|nr:hypothetical protein [Planctomycetaceae bacterium]
MKRRIFAALCQRTWWAWLLAPLAAFGCGAGLQADPPAAATKESTSPADANAAELGEKWVRLLKDKDDEPVALETAIVRYVKAADVVPGQPAADYREYVDLVGAVHIADKRYYRDLNRRFKGYDSVLYELVAPEGTEVPRGRGTPNTHPLGMLQNGMKSMLEVEHQLEQIDYTRDNMVHADLSPDEFVESMAKRDEGFLQMYFKLQGAAMAQQSKAASEGVNADFDILAAMFSDDRPRQLKIAMAQQFEGMEALMTGFSGPEGSTLITDRNARALEVLKKRLKAGDKQVAIFYGAGHLAEMDEQLEKEFGLKPVGVEWVEAWDLRE